MASARFRYPLDALLRKRRSDWKTVKLEELAATRVVENRGAEVEQARGGMEETEQLLRAARRGGAPMDPIHQHRVGSYLAHQRAVLHERQQALQLAHELRERVRSNLDGISRGIKSLEKHREGRESEHRLVQDQLEQKRTDELWLLARGAREPD